MLAVGGLAPLAGWAQGPKQQSSRLDGLVVLDPRLVLVPSVAGEDAVGAQLDPDVAQALRGFRGRARGQWQAYFDRRSGRLDSAIGSGIPWIAQPGPGAARVDLASLERTARAFVAQTAPLLGADVASLVLNSGRSGQWADYLWSVDFDVQRGGMTIEGARVFFHVNNGNLVEFGTENLPGPGVQVPAQTLTVDDAFAVLEGYVGDLDPNLDTFSDAGSLHLLPVQSPASRAPGGAPFGQGYGLVLVWQFQFHRDGVVGTWRARVDATTGELLGFTDVNEYATAQVTGGAYAQDCPTAGCPATELVLPMPFADLSIGGFTSSAGLYNYTSGTVSSTLNGQYVRITDTCGAISQSGNAGTSGNILFGTSGGTDCTTPGTGGAGNTHSSRTQFYNVNRIKEKGRAWLPANAWLAGKLTVNVNLNQTCNAYWNGTTLNFFRSGGGCSNTGELPGVSLHEWGHGLDQNDGNGSQAENGSGESYGDFSATLQTHDSCLGSGFLPGTTCSGYGDTCTACSGVRDIDYAQHILNTPATVDNFTRVRCPSVSNTYVGPCGQDAIARGLTAGPTNQTREGHCESYVSSEALWDLAARDLPSPGSGSAWATTDRLWYLSRSTETKMFQCNVSGGTRTTGTWTSDGCFAGSLWRTFRTVDDDDGNLANGTPHGGAIYAAFNRHGIACAGDAGATLTFSGCTPPPTPTLTVVPSANQVSLSWTNSGVGYVYDVLRNESGCNAGFTKISNDLATTTLTDSAVSNGYTYYYEVAAQPTGNEACSSAPSACLQVVLPCPGTTSLSATPNGANRIDLNWGAVGGATGYKVFRSATSGGPYSLLATVGAVTVYSDTTVSAGVTYYYVIHALTTCESGDSPEASAAASAGTCDLPPLFGGVQSVVSQNAATCGLLVSWQAGTSQCSGTLAYNVYRSTSAVFTPSGANRIAAGAAGTSYVDTAGLANGTTYYYIVRAVDSANLAEDGNAVVQSAAPRGVPVTTTLYSENFDTCTALCGWVTGIFATGAANSWRGVQTCTAHSGTKIFRFGGTTCTNNYASNNNSYARPPATLIPAGALNTRLSFWHTWAFENGYDGGRIRVSVDGASYYTGQLDAYLLNPPNGVANNGSFAAWTNTQATFVNSTVDLDKICNIASGTSTGCQGRTIYTAFTSFTDGSVNAAGWNLDDVAISADTPGTCTNTPSPLQFFTATSTSAQNQLEWQTPVAGACSSIRVLARTDTYPTGPADGLATTVGNVACAGNNTHGTVLHSALTNGTSYFYAAYVNDGAGNFSPGSKVQGRPQDTVAGPVRWVYNTGAASLAPPGFGGAVYAVSNDRVLHSMAGGSTGGVWPSSPAQWTPFAMNAPSQQRPPVVPVTIGSHTKIVFLGSQDGRAYAIDANDGSQAWASPVLGAMVQAAPSGFIAAFGAPFSEIIVGTRNSAADNAVYGLKLADGTLAWKFDNGGGAGGIGIVSGAASLDYASRRVYFASRQRAGGSANTVWCLQLDATGSTASLLWGQALGDVDGSPILYNGRVYVGTNASQVYALDAATGATLWAAPFAAADGPVKGYVTPRFNSSPVELFFSTNGKLWSVLDNGGSAALNWSLATIASPSVPLYRVNSPYLYVGSSDGRLYELTLGGGAPTAKSLALGAGTAAVGAPGFDTLNGLLQVGSDLGAVYAVSVPLP